MKDLVQIKEPYLSDGSGCLKCNFTGRFGGWIGGQWNGYPQIKCQDCHAGESRRNEKETNQYKYK